MRVSVSAPSDAVPSRRGTMAAAAVALAWLLAHLPFLAPSLEDIDSINFALGLHDFDPARHQPHPPGYPVYIVLGRLALAVIRAAISGSTARGISSAPSSSRAKPFDSLRSPRPRS